MLKKEIRILGLSSSSNRRKKVPVVGVVFRGSSWLDGVFTCILEPGRRDYLSDLARAIMQSRQYSQVHAVILSREDLVAGTRINVSALAHKVSLPVISLIERSNPRRAKGHYLFAMRGRPILVRAAGISYARTREVFSIGCAGNHRIPEAVRVADLMTTHLA